MLCNLKELLARILISAWKGLAKTSWTSLQGTTETATLSSAMLILWLSEMLMNCFHSVIEHTLVLEAWNVPFKVSHSLALEIPFLFISFSPGCLLSSTFLGSLGRSSSLTYSGPPQGGLQYGSNCLSTAGWWGELSCCQCLPWGLWMTRALCTSTLVPTALVFLCGSLGLTLSY